MNVVRCEEEMCFCVGTHSVEYILCVLYVLCFLHFGCAETNSISPAFDLERRKECI